MMFKFIHPLILSILFIGFSCDDDDSILPDATSEGKNTFGCKVNDREWNAVTPVTAGIKAVEASYFEDDNFIIVSATRKTVDHFESIEFTIYELDGTGSYTIGKHAKGSGLFIDNNRSDDHKEFHTSTDRGGTAKINKFDQNRKILSGTFEFEATNATGSKVEITDGRFDITYESR